MKYYKRLREDAENLQIMIGDVIPEDYQILKEGVIGDVNYTPDFTNVSYWQDVTKQHLKDKKFYTCTDCQRDTPLIDNGEITVGYCDYCEHPLWND